MAEEEATTGSGGVAGSLKKLKSGLDDLVLQTVLSAGQPISVGASKEPLSLQTTSNNFRKFVQKSGPIFAAQDAAEAVFRWEDTPKTLFFGGAWAFFCLYPFLLFIIPNLLLTSILLTTHPKRHSRGTSLNPDTPTDEAPLSVAPPAEGSVDYLANLTNIQAMMGQISDASDLLRSFVPYLTWRDERVSLVILQLTVISGLFFAFVSPFIPWRFVFLVAGECAILAGHPITQSLFKETSPLLRAKAKRWKVRLERLMEDDGLTDEELDSEMLEVERFDTETKLDGLFVADLSVGGELPSNGANGWRWVGKSDWKVDLLGDWADGNVDDNGWAYLFIDGSRSSSPTSTIGQAGSRRRRLSRRAVNVLHPDP